MASQGPELLLRASCFLQQYKSNCRLLTLMSCTRTFLYLCIHIGGYDRVTPDQKEHLEFLHETIYTRTVVVPRSSLHYAHAKQLGDHLWRVHGSTREIHMIPHTSKWKILWIKRKKCRDCWKSQEDKVWYVLDAQAIRQKEGISEIIVCVLLWL